MPILTDDDLRHFGTEGYLVVRNVVPEHLLAAADIEFDEFVAETVRKEGPSPLGQTGYAPHRDRVPRCDDVLKKSPALSIAQELVAPSTIDHTGLDGPDFDLIQLCITVPPWDENPGCGHIDGDEPGYSFSLLAGVLLTDQSEPMMGNLWVWPGSHLDQQQMFRERGTSALINVGGHAYLLDPAIIKRPGIPILGRRGDLILSHFMTSHNKGGNTAKHIRRTIYYRLNVPGHIKRSESILTDALLEYPAVRAAMDSAPPA